MDLYYEFELAVDTVTLVVTLRWYTSDAPEAEPILTEQQTHMLTDAAVTPSKVAQAVMDRAVEVRRGVELYVAVIEAFGGAQNTRIAAP